MLFVLIGASAKKNKSQSIRDTRGIYFASTWKEVLLDINHVARSRPCFQENSKTSTSFCEKNEKKKNESRDLLFCLFINVEQSQDLRISFLEVSNKFQYFLQRRIAKMFNVFVKTRRACKTRRTTVLGKRMKRTFDSFVRRRRNCTTPVLILGVELQYDRDSEISIACLSLR